MITRIPRRLATAVKGVLALLLASIVLFGAAGPASASYAEIEGSGSTWSYTIVQQWIADVSASGMQIAYNNNGSSQGRKDFANGVTDFGISEIPYQGIDPISHTADQSARPYAYLPIVAGGTAFTYQLTVGGKRVTNLRLSGETIAKIFTNKITSWNDPEITRENGGHALPALPITPVVRSDGSGTTAQFTRWMDIEYPSIWRPYNGAAGLTSQYPRQGRQVAASGSDQVMNTITSQAGNGTIGYVEYSYPLNAHYPVVYVENKAGYYVQPTQYNVAVALTKAQIDMRPTIGGKQNLNYLTQQLNGVYNDTDPRAYPISSYSYMIIPTSKTDIRMTVDKRQTLADFLSYSLCTGQSKAGAYGYSPLPLNLVKAAFGQVERLGPRADGGAVSGVHIKDPSGNLASCNNPTFVKGDLSRNHLADIAPLPLACQKSTSVPCGDSTVPPGTNGSTGGTNPGGNNGSTNGSNPNSNSANGSDNSGNPGSSHNSGNPGSSNNAGTPGSNNGTNGSDPASGGATGAGTGGTTGTGATGGSSTNSGANSANTSSASSKVDPTTGQPVSSDGAANGAATTNGAAANVVNISPQRNNHSRLFGGIAVLELLAVVLLPGLFAAVLRRRRDL